MHNAPLITAGNTGLTVNGVTGSMTGKQGEGVDGRGTLTGKCIIVREK